MYCLLWLTCPPLAQFARHYRYFIYSFDDRVTPSSVSWSTDNHNVLHSPGMSFIHCVSLLLFLVSLF